MRFLVDAQLPAGLCAWLEQRGFEAEHVADRLGGQTPDVAIAEYAKKNSVILISKDGDFAFRFPPLRYRLLWLRCGNITNRALSVWLTERWTPILVRLKAGERLIEVR